MKRHGNLWEQVISFEALLRAADKARKGKRFRPAVAAFHFDQERALWKLHEELTTKTYRPGFEPVVAATLKVGDIVLCKVNGKQYLHLVKAIQGKRFQIGNNRGRINGWVGENSIFGKCTRIE